MDVMKWGNHAYSWSGHDGSHSAKFSGSKWKYFLCDYWVFQKLGLSTIWLHRLKFERVRFKMPSRSLSTFTGYLSGLESNTRLYYRHSKPLTTVHTSTQLLYLAVRPIPIPNVFTPSPLLRPLPDSWCWPEPFGPSRVLSRRGDNLECQNADLMMTLTTCFIWFKCD